MKPLPTFAQEQSLWEQQLTGVAGVDEAGRGPWAGPVYAAAVIWQTTQDPEALLGLTDSKLLTARQRESWACRIEELAAAIGIGRSDAREIDRLGILPATKLAMLRALRQLKELDFVLLDAICFRQEDLDLLLDDCEPDDGILTRQRSFIRGEQVSLSIAAASVMAKVSRDREMTTLAEQYPVYGFQRHKGYGTREHQRALLRYGPCPIHRLTFKPVRRLVEIGL